MPAQDAENMLTVEYINKTHSKVQENITEESRKDLRVGRQGEGL